MGSIDSNEPPKSSQRNMDVQATSQLDDKKEKEEKETAEKLGKLACQVYKDVLKAKNETSNSFSATWQSVILDINRLIESVVRDDMGMSLLTFENEKLFINGIVKKFLRNNPTIKDKMPELIFKNPNESIKINLWESFRDYSFTHYHSLCNYIVPDYKTQFVNQLSLYYSNEEQGFDKFFKRLVEVINDYSEELEGVNKLVEFVKNLNKDNNASQTKFKDLLATSATELNTNLEKLKGSFQILEIIHNNFDKIISLAEKAKNESRDYVFQL